MSDLLEQQQFRVSRTRRSCLPRRTLLQTMPAVLSLSPPHRRPSTTTTTATTRCFPRAQRTHHHRSWISPPKSFPRESFECSVQQNQRFQRGNIPERRFQADAESRNDAVVLARLLSRRSRLASIETTSSIFVSRVRVVQNVWHFHPTKKRVDTFTHTHATHALRKSK